MNKKILVIDDDVQIRNLYRDALEDYDYDVEIAENGKVGLRLYPTFKPNAVILDVLMPEKEGIETIRELLQLDAKASVIAVSGGGKIEADTYLNLMRRFGAKEVFEKPVSMERLALSIEHHGKDWSAEEE